MFGAVTKPIKTAALKRNHQGTRSEEFGARAVGASRRNLYRQWTAYIAGERIDVVRALLLVRHVGDEDVPEPEIKANRINIDTGCVYGGVLTAAAFTSEQVAPAAFLTAREDAG